MSNPFPSADKTAFRMSKLAGRGGRTSVGEVTEFAKCIIGVTADMPKLADGTHDAKIIEQCSGNLKDPLGKRVLRLAKIGDKYAKSVPRRTTDYGVRRIPPRKPSAFMQEMDEIAELPEDD